MFFATGTRSYVCGPEDEPKPLSLVQSAGSGGRAERHARSQSVEIGDRAVIIPLCKLRHAARVEGHGCTRINNPDASCSRRIHYPPGSIRAISGPELAALQTRG